ncbi:phage integrase [Acidocella sp. MX-AZ02]|nr:phage integrase [Acidocella sp. MX-AZ02]
MLDAEFGRALPQLRDRAMSAEAEIQAILKAKLKTFLDEDLERRMTRKPFSAVYAHWWEIGDPQTSDEADLRAIRNAQDSLRRDLVQNSPVEMGDYAAALIKERGLPPELLNHLTYGLIEAAIKGWEIAERRTLGQEPVVMLAESALPAVPVPPVTPEAPKAPTRPLASSYVDDFQAWGTASSGWRAGPLKQALVSLAMFREVVGDLPVDQYTPEHTEQFRAVLRKLPMIYRKSPKEKDKPLAEIIAESPPGAHLLSDKTVKRHFWAVSRFFEFLKETGRLPRTFANPAQGFTFKAKGSVRDDRDMWTGKELAALFASPIWTGCNPFYRARAGDQIIRDGIFWLPLLGAFHGNRLEEFAQLRGADVAQAGDIWFLNITDEDGRQLKNAQSRRRVPLHSELIKLGFLQYVQATAPAPDAPVFPDLKPRGVDAKQGYSFTKRFSAYRRAIGVYRKGLDYHSFRHGVTTKLFEADVNEGWIDLLTGHESGGESRKRYLKGIPLEKLKEAIERVTWPEVDLSWLYVERAD